MKVGVRKSNFGGAERFPKHLVPFIPAGGFGARSYGGTPQLCCYLLHFRPSPIRGGPNPCALPIESAYGPFGGLGEGQENLGGNRAGGLPAWFRLPSASPGGGFGSCSHRDVACEPRRTADLVTVPLLLLRVRLLVTVPLLLLRVRLPLSGLLTLAGRNAFQSI